LRGQIGTKDAQIKGSLPRRSRETNILIGGLQRMLTSASQVRLIRNRRRPSVTTSNPTWERRNNYFSTPRGHAIDPSRAILIPRMETTKTAPTPPGRTNQSHDKSLHGRKHVASARRRCAFCHRCQTPLRPARRRSYSTGEVREKNIVISTRSAPRATGQLAHKVFVAPHQEAFRLRPSRPERNLIYRRGSADSSVRKEWGGRDSEPTLACAP